MLIRNWITGALAISVSTILSPCVAATQSSYTQEPVLPNQAPAIHQDGWSVATPAQAGFDPLALASLTDAVQSGRIRNVHAIIVEHKGRLIYEQYFSGRDERWGEQIGTIEHSHDSLHDIRSVTKSITSALLGIALGDHFAEAINRPITEYFKDLQGEFGKGVEDITLKHVLTMTAGLEWNEMTVPYTSEKNDEIRLYKSTDPVKLVLARAVRDAAGSRWYYNGGLTQVLAGLIHRKTGKRLDHYAKDVLFEPLGITEFEWLGSSIWPPQESPSAASGLRMKARDLAKIGSLMLNGGKWKGRQIIPAQWIKLSTQRHIKQIPWGHEGVYGYGFMWYPGKTKGSNGYRVIRAAGNGDQRLLVVPQAGVAVTVLAGNYNKFAYRSGEKVLARVMVALNRNQ